MVDVIVGTVLVLALGLATALNELAEASGLAVVLVEGALPVRSAVNAACEILGIDPLYVANEGKLVAFVAPDDAEEVCARARHRVDDAVHGAAPAPYRALDLITGAARGLGAQMARRFRDEGATPIITDLSEPDCRTLADELDGDAYALDVTDSAAVAEVSVGKDGACCSITCRASVSPTSTASSSTAANRQVSPSLPDGISSARKEPQQWARS